MQKIDLGFKKSALRILTILGALASAHVNASITYNYAGNPFDNSNIGLVGDSIVGSVTFSNPAINNTFTGDVFEADVSHWSIQVAQLPATKQDNTSADHKQFPLFFHFENGAITAWQLLASPPGQTFPEIFTTHNSTTPSISPTADFFEPNLIDRGFNLDQPGTWSVAAVPIPAAAWLFISALGSAGFVRRRTAS